MGPQGRDDPTAWVEDNGPGLPALEHMDLTKNDIVDVWAAGRPEQKVRATVLVISENQ
jgi:hypothetical protein